MKNNLRQMRKKSGLTVAKFAAAMGVSEVTVSAWEGGRRGMPVTRALKALDVLAQNRVHATLDSLLIARAA